MFRRAKTRPAATAGAIRAINAEHVQGTVYGQDPYGAAMAFALASAEAFGLGPGANGTVTANPVNTFGGDAVVPVQQFLGEGQLEANLGGGAPTNNPVVSFHQTDSNPLYDDPVMAALVDQASRGA